MGVEERELSLKSAAATVRRMEQEEAELRTEIAEVRHVLADAKATIAAKESALEQSRRAAQVSSADSKLALARLQQDLAAANMAKASLERQLAELVASATRQEFDEQAKHANAPYVVLGAPV